MHMHFRFAVVADSHIRSPHDGSGEYPSNAVLADRSRRVVALLNRLQPSFVVHLGDIVHPLPVDDAAHRSAVRLASEVYGQLGVPIHFVAGNHDVGDKPGSLVAVPAVADEFYEVFETAWGPAFRSFDHADRHFVLIDTPALNSGLDRESLQWAWLEQDLESAVAAGRRTFLFGHYPPFIRHPEEPEHYDNLAEPARSRLLDLLVRHDTEAVFSGHVHNFAYNRLHGIDLYVVPATGFVRPDYAEMATVAPQGEGGRDDPAKLGFLVVEVDAAGHRVRPIRTFGLAPRDPRAPVDPELMAHPRWRCPVGVTLRHGWASTVELPTEGLDEFRRKTVRNDYPLLALWEARIPAVRVPIGDVVEAAGRSRLADLRERGLRFTVFSAGLPGAATLRAVGELAPSIDRWELIIDPDDLVGAVALTESLKTTAPLLALAPVTPVGSEHEAVHHFVSHGFDPEKAEHPMRWLRAGAAGFADELVFSASPHRPVLSSIADASEIAASLGVGAVVVVRLPRAGESEVFEDDDAVTRLVAGTVTAARAHPEVTVFLDGFLDHDRGYYRRHGLVDRSYNPRPALYALAAGAQAGPTGGQVSP